MNNINITISILSGSILLILLSVFCIYLLLFYRRKKTIYESEKKEITENFNRQLLSTQLEIKEQTLSQISRELHDNIGQAITFARMNLNTINTENTPDAKEKITNANDILLEALADLRNISRSMLGEKIAETGTEAAIRNHLRFVKNNDMYVIKTESEGELFLLGYQREIFAFRIVQETLNNIFKHSGANKIHIRFYYRPEELEINVEDNGRGFDEATLSPMQKGTGLINMYKRADLLNAKLSFDKLPSCGICMKLIIPKNITPS